MPLHADVGTARKHKAGKFLRSISCATCRQQHSGRQGWRLCLQRDHEISTVCKRWTLFSRVPPLCASAASAADPPTPTSQTCSHSTPGHVAESDPDLRIPVSAFSLPPLCLSLSLFLSLPLTGRRVFHVRSAALCPTWKS